MVFGHKVADGFRVGPALIAARPRGRHRLQRDLGAVMELVDLANLYDKQIEPETWEIVRRNAATCPTNSPRRQ